MKRLVILLAVLGLLLVALSATHSLRAPEPVPERPKQSPYVIYSYVCGSLELVLIMSDPPIVVDPENPAAGPLLHALQAAPENRIIELRYQGSQCSRSKRT